MRPAPPFDCASCGRRIGRARGHWLLTGRRVVCSACFCAAPDSETTSHSGTRAGIAAYLGLWPSPEVVNTASP